MNDAVFDTTVVSIGNNSLANRKPGNSVDLTLHLFENVFSDKLRVRYNSKLRREYEDHVKERRNDLVELFFAMLDSERAILVPRNTLVASDYDLAVAKAKWPHHDQHLIAAAVNGNRPHIYITESRHLKCAAGIYRRLKIRVQTVLSN